MKENNMEDAPNTEASMQSGTKCKLLCNPRNLPNPYLPKMEEYDRMKETVEIKRQLREYFWLQKFKKPTKTRRER